ncbi:hypothetical protein HPB47_026488 [Ixodes persulcatus]|uniref:Uncharacterized protein n=1 Tax=Ixodes persulcatus TaxID=34615 RepID=A0AC60PZ97_IXOPE|nr:hypothetical protein HPB47_026488 [Ixodes persulcatus]
MMLGCLSHGGSPVSDYGEHPKSKVEFLTGTAKKPGAEAAEVAAGLKRKSKWDVGSVQTGGVMMPAQLKPATLVTPQVVPVSLPTGTKPTVISAFGTLPKKTKQ